MASEQPPTIESTDETKVAASGSTSGGEALPTEPVAPNIAGYEILSMVGKGGMGEVWKAVDSYTNRVVALKCIPEDRVPSPADCERFLGEIRNAARLDHPFIARVYESCLQRGFLGYTMEFVEGVPLDAFLRSNPLPLDERLRLFVNLAAGVHYATAAA